MSNTLEKLTQKEVLSDEEVSNLLRVKGEEQKELFQIASDSKKKFFDGKTQTRLCIELSNMCKNSCLYCGMRGQNNNLKRFKLTVEKIKEILEEHKGSRVDMIQFSSGEGSFYTAEELSEIIKEAKKYSEEIILATGLKTDKEYQDLFDAGATAYVIKFETSQNEKFDKIKPDTTLKERLEHLEKLKNTGYKIGSGNIVGLPGQNIEDIMDDLKLMKNLGLHIAESSVFCPNSGSAYCHEKRGDENITLNCIALTRTMLTETPLVLASSSLGERIKDAFKAGANLVSIHATPEDVFKDYSVYGGADRLRITAKKIEQLNKR